MFSFSAKAPGFAARKSLWFIVGILMLMSPHAFSAECKMDLDGAGASNAFASLNPGALNSESFCETSGFGADCAAQYKNCESQIKQRMDQSAQQAQQEMNQQRTSQDAPQTLASGSAPAMAAEIIFRDEFHKFKNAKDSCLKKFKTARTACNPTQNDSMTQMGQAAAGLLEAFAGGGQAACSNMGDLLKKAMGALAAFRGSCGALKGSCSNTCEGVMKMAQDASKHLNQCAMTQNSVPPNPQFASIPGLQGMDPKEQARAACTLAKDYFDTESMEMTQRGRQIASEDPEKEIQFNEKAEAENLTVKDAVRLCASFQETLKKAAGNGLQMMGMDQASKQCEKAQSEDPALAEAMKDYCTEFPDTPECQNLAELDCSNPAIAATDPTCICEANPDDAACAKIASTQGTDASAGQVADFSSSLKEDDFDGLSDGSTGLDPLASVKQQGNPGLGAGGSVGAGGPTVGTGNDIQSGAGGDAEGGYGGAGYDDNVILGSGGGSRGGGGGFKFNRRNGGDNAYKKFLPKIGAKVDDKKKNEKSEITGSGGPSNFDKVSQRYQANRRTLLPE